MTPILICSLCQQVDRHARFFVLPLAQSDITLTFDYGNSLEVLGNSKTIRVKHVM